VLLCSSCTVLISTDSQLLFLFDSLSCLQSLNNRDLLRACFVVRWYHIFMWVSSHVGLAGNSAADNQHRLHAIELKVNIPFTLPRNEIIICRLRIGHTYLMHGHLLRGKTPPRCLAWLVKWI